ncbi:MAG: hypothetical protein ACLQLO_23410 [Mycobacterium sp.]
MKRWKVKENFELAMPYDLCTNLSEKKAVDGGEDTLRGPGDDAAAVMSRDIADGFSSGHR